MLRKESRNLIVSVVYVWRGKAYIPVEARYESGIFVGIEPVYVTTIDIQEITNAIRAVKDAGHKQLPDMKTREEFLARKDPILSATGARSWKQLAKTGACYTIGWTDKEIRIDMARLNKKGVWEHDLEKTKILSPDSQIEQIVAIILEDLKTRREAVETSNTK